MAALLHISNEKQGVAWYQVGQGLYRIYQRNEKTEVEALAQGVAVTGDRNTYTCQTVEELRGMLEEHEFRVKDVVFCLGLLIQLQHACA